MEAILTSSVIAALVAAVVSVFSTERRISAEYVIQERKLWRDKIRTLASEIYKTLTLSNAEEPKLGELRAEFSLLINPLDIMDEEILALISVNNKEKANEFTRRVALLLKHDWERAKHEASFLKKLCTNPPKRVPFSSDLP